MSLIIVDQAKVQAKADADRIAELKKLLADSDYKVLPGYDRPTESIMAQREAWRLEVRALEQS
jgi:glyoxylase-like metal-dependent hydrolase (beta-lactamase superfamily II)